MASVYYNNYGATIGAYQKPRSPKDSTIYFRANTNEDSILFTPYEAREAARALKRWADLVDPPRTRKKTSGR